MYRTVRAHLKELAIDNHHFAVEVLKRAQTEHAVPSQCSDWHGALVNALDESGGSGDLIERMVRDLTICRDHGRMSLICNTGAVSARTLRQRAAFSIRD